MNLSTPEAKGAVLVAPAATACQFFRLIATHFGLGLRWTDKRTQTFCARLLTGERDGGHGLNHSRELLLLFCHLFCRANSFLSVVNFSFMPHHGTLAAAEAAHITLASPRPCAGREPWRGRHKATCYWPYPSAETEATIIVRAAAGTGSCFLQLPSPQFFNA